MFITSLAFAMATWSDDNDDGCAVEVDLRGGKMESRRGCYIEALELTFLNVLT